MTLGVKRSAIRKAIARGTLPATKGPGKFGDAYAISREDLEAYRARETRERRLGTGS
jgi:excisionase family DNA binding protein